MKAINIKTEYLKNPLGIDIENPRLMWNCEGGVTQTAYQIVTDEWDSGKVESGSMRAAVPVKFEKGKRVTFKIRLWDENDKEDEFSEENFFEYGIKNWSAKWITGNYEVDKKGYEKQTKIEKSFFLSGVNMLATASKPEADRFPVDYFKKEFGAKKNVKSARLYATACGIYSAYINGKKVSMPLAPGITDYRKRVQYQTYDVTDLIKEKNIINIDLADGWYRGSCGAWGLKNQYGCETKILAQLEIQYADGTKDTVATDSSWLWSNDGAISFADNKDGEIVDANKVPTYYTRAKLTSHNVLPSASNNVPIAEKETFKGEMTTAPSGKKLINFKQNMAGYVSFKINAKKEQKITIRFGEMLDENGELTLKNIQCSNKKITTPLQTIKYTCKDGVNEYKPNFAIFGFTYMEIDTDIEVSADNFTAIAVYSDMEETGFFESSNELLNKFVTATKWSTKSNSTDLPTDCPTRERHGWTGDAQIFFNTAAYLFDYATFSEKYIRDVYDWQQKDGKLPQIVPYGGVDFFMSWMNGSVGWSDVGVLIPYRFWKIYNDDYLIKRYYAGMVKYAKFMISRCGKWTPLKHNIRLSSKNSKYFVNFGQSYGEWAEPKDVFPNDWKNTVLPNPEESTAYTSYIMSLMCEIAKYMNDSKNLPLFEEYKKGCAQAYRELITKNGYSIDTDRQAKLVRPLYMHLLDEKSTEFAKKRLVKALDNYGWRLGTGFLSTPFILDVLADINIDYAYKLLENEEMPGWLFMPKNGATTIWESWEGTKAQGGIASLNHYSKGAVCEWLFKAMCGITVDGENHFVIKPLPGGHFDFAKAEYKSIFGTVKSGWKKQNDKYIYEIEIPANCTAEIVLPNDEKHAVKAGEYSF